jgi:hypothetical protein
VLIAGTADIIEGYGHPGASVLASYGPSEFLGEIGMLTGQRAFLSAVATSAGRVLAVPVAQLRRVMAQEPGLSDLILRTFLLRHSILKLDVVHMPVLSSFGRMQDDEHVVVVRLHLWDTVSLHGVLHGHGMEPEHLPEHTHRLLVTGGNVHPYETVLSFEQLLQLRYAALLDPTVAKKTNVHWTHILKPGFALGGLSYGALPRRIVVVYVRRRHRAGLVNLIAGLLW